jgi:hypothetical protein
MNSPDLKAQVAVFPGRATDFELIDSLAGGEWRFQQEQAQIRA